MHDPSHETGGEFAVYRLYDAAGDLLYVGATRRVDVRMSDHRSKQPWGNQIARNSTRFEWFSTAKEASARESECITNEGPRHNKHGNPGYPPSSYSPAPRVHDTVRLFDMDPIEREKWMRECDDLIVECDELLARGGR